MRYFLSTYLKQKKKIKISTSFKQGKFEHPNALPKNTKHDTCLKETWPTVLSKTSVKNWRLSKKGYFLKFNQKNNSIYNNQSMVQIGKIAYRVKKYQSDRSKRVPVCGGLEARVGEPLPPERSEATRSEYLATARPRPNRRHTQATAEEE